VTTREPSSARPESPEDSALASPGRLRALRQLGLSARADPGMDRFARMVAGWLGVPIALVSLVGADRQLLPGQVGLAEPWATRRETPLSHSLCQHVVTTGQPLVLADAQDARQDGRTGAPLPGAPLPGAPLPGAALAVEDLGVVGYAGMPLTDSDGHVLGSLCAVDTRPRAWSEQELADLADLAAACCAELRLRLVSRQALDAQHGAEVARRDAEAALQVAERSDARAQAYAVQAQVALERSELMLRAAEDLADTMSLTDVRRRVQDLVSSDLKPSYVGLAVLDRGRLHRIPDPAAADAVELAAPAYSVRDDWPSARAAREGRTVAVTSRDALAAGYGPEAVAAFGLAGLGSAVCLPLHGTRGVLGTLMMGWATAHEVDVTERAVLIAIAGYTAQAVERARYVDERVSVARLLQQAMLTDLPTHPGLELAAFYQAAATDELVGGDWYDAYLLDSEALPGPAAPLAITVGDITGHDMNAAATMGQVRSMLRQADFDHRGQGPARAVTAMERACHALPLDATGTLVHAHLHPAPGGGGWNLTWTNAGHPPPLVAGPDGRTERLDQHELLLWPGKRDYHRTGYQRLLSPGTTLLLYTDGLVERRRQDIDQAIGLAARALTAASGQPLAGLGAHLTGRIAGPAAEDDVVMLLVRVPA
jgi:GAF domain-containing protein